VFEVFCRALDSPQATEHDQAELRKVAIEAPEEFLKLALGRLRAPNLTTLQRRHNSKLFDVPEFLVRLLMTDGFTAAELAAFLAAQMSHDRLLDVKLARLLPRPGHCNGLAPEVVVRLLTVLEELSPGPRLLIPLNQMTAHPDPRIASKATLLIARRLHNKGWMERQLRSGDARLRANVVEALWGVQTGFSRELFYECLGDSNNRVVGNALVGLHKLDDCAVLPRLRALLKDCRSEFRVTGAWVARHIEAIEMLPLLEELAVKDEEPGVRAAASRALEPLREAARRRAVPELPAAAPEAPRRSRVGEEAWSPAPQVQPASYVTSIRRF